MNTNKNIDNFIMSYLNCKDLSNLAQVNKKCLQSSNNFECVWRGECVSYFSSGYEHYSLLPEGSDLCLKSSLNDFQLNTQESWKLLFQKMVENSIELKNVNGSILCEMQNLEEDLILTDELMCSSLKEIFALPKLRKENMYVENDFNSSHQICMFDLLYENQEITEFYEEQFNNNNGELISIRKPELPFSQLLENYIDTFLLFQKKSNEKLLLKKIKCYEHFHYTGDNILLSLFTKIMTKIQLFCKITHQFIKEIGNKNIENKEQLIANEYIKRNKAFIDAAMYINEILENLNVLVNKLNDDCYPGGENIFKFSMYQMMMSFWNKEVLIPLIEGNGSYNLMDITCGMFRRYMKKQIEKSIKSNNNEGTGHSSVSTVESECSLRSSYGIDIPKKNKEMFEESLNSLNLKYFIEQLTSSILDLYCCEYSTYYLNHTEMKTGKYYQLLENNFSQILFELTSLEECKSLTEAQSVELFCDESFFGLRFINKTLKALVKVLQQSEENTFENKFTKTNKRIEKENKRRNIPFKHA